MPTLAAESGLEIASGQPARRLSTWLVGPRYDALLVANVAWPLLVGLQFTETFSGQAGLQFWQIYYVTTPHRWITLALVFLDREQFQRRPTTFLAIAAAVAVLCLGVRFTTGALTCLLAIDYLWNAWHFAAQHHGVYRIYNRISLPTQARGELGEKWGLRAFLLYVILRVASATWSDEELLRQLRLWDFVALAIPVGLMIRAFCLERAHAAGRRLYLFSMLGLYVSLLWAVHEHRPGLVLALATGSALFHAIEYLALVTWSVHRRHAGYGSQLGLLAHAVSRWGLVLGFFVVILGAMGWLMDQKYVEAWLTINVIVAFLHYAYDGLIWRRR